MRSIESFADLVAGLNEDYLSGFLQVDLKTLRRWKRGTAKPPHAVTLLLRLKFESDLAALGGPDWEGFRLCGHDGKLYHPFWSRGFDAGQLKAMFFQVQDAWADKRDLERLRAELVELRKSEAFYRRQCQVESRMGLMLSRIAG